MNRRRNLLLTLASGLLLAACSDSAVLQITNVTPTAGSAGTAITLLGSGLDNSTSATVCGVVLTDLRLETEERQAAAPGTVGKLVGASSLQGTVPDLGASAACPVIVSSALGDSHTWSGEFHYTSVVDAPANEAPTTSGLSDLLVDGVTSEHIIDLDSAFDDENDGVDSLSFSATVTAPSGNVLATVTGKQLQLDFPSRLAHAAQVEVRATDPHGAGVNTTFNVEFEAGTLEVKPEARYATAPPPGEIIVTHDSGEQLTAVWNNPIALRAGSYEVRGTDVIVPGTFIDHREVSELAPASIVAGGTELIELRYIPLEATGRLWLPTLYEGLWSFDDGALLDLSIEPTSKVMAHISYTAASLAPDGALWLANYTDGSIERFESEDLTSLNPTPTTKLQWSGAPMGSLAYVSRLTFDVSGNLWISAYENQSIFAYTAEQLEAGGDLQPSYIIGDSIEVPIRGPGALTFDADGNLWVGTTTSVRVIYRFDADDLFTPNLKPSFTITPTWQSTRFFDLKFGANGDMWFTTDTLYLGRIAASSLTANGTLDFDARTGIALPGISVMSLMFDPRGNLWALTRDGHLSTIMATELDQPAPAVITRDLGTNVDPGAFLFLE